MPNFSILTSWDDGTEEDLRLIKLLKKYKLPAIFFVPIKSWGFDNLYKYEGFAIGSHTVRHPQDLKLLSDPTLEEELMTSKTTLEEVLGTSIDWFCYPRGRYNQRVKDVVKKAGYKYARTTHVGSITKIDDQDPLEIDTTVHVGYDRAEYNGDSWLNYATKNLNRVQKRGGLYHIWGHSAEIDRNNGWAALEKLFSKL